VQGAPHEVRLRILIPLGRRAFVGAPRAEPHLALRQHLHQRRGQAKAQGCKLVEGGNVTVVQGTKVNGANAAAPRCACCALFARRAAAAAASQHRLRRTEGARRRSPPILEAELKKAEARQAELQKEYNNGEPEKLGPSTATTRSTSTASPS
jgi:hypothetical protein